MHLHDKLMNLLLSFGKCVEQSRRAPVLPFPVVEKPGAAAGSRRERPGAAGKPGCEGLFVPCGGRCWVDGSSPCSRECVQPGPWGGEGRGEELIKQPPPTPSPLINSLVGEGAEMCTRQAAGGECRTMGRGNPWGFDAESLVPGEQAGTPQGLGCPSAGPAPPCRAVNGGGAWSPLEQVCGWETSVGFRSSNPSASAWLRGRAGPFVLPASRGGGGGRSTGPPRVSAGRPRSPLHPRS